MADHLKTHTRAGSLLGRILLSELKNHFSMVYTPAYDPDANRIEWLWRVSRRVVTHNHHRSSFELLLADQRAAFSDTGSDSRRGSPTYRQSLYSGQASGCSSASRSGRIIIL